MKTLKFKTNIKCSGCVAQVTPHLNAEKSIAHWQVDTANPEKILTVQGDHPNEKTIVEAIKRAVFTLEKKS